jgi:hypothetical protein
MSDQQATGIGVVLDLEELFLSREFGRRPVRLVSTAPATVASEPAQLEQVFRSDVFGHPEVVAAAVRVVEQSAPALSGQPTLVLLRGGAEAATARDSTHHRAIAAVSGVAAAALAVAGLASGTGQGPGRAPVTEQAQGASPSPGQTRSGGGSQPGPGALPTGPAVLSKPSGGGTPVASEDGGTNAALISYTAPVPVPAPLASPQGAAGGGAATAPAPPAPGGGGSSPGTPSGAGGGGGSTTDRISSPGCSTVSMFGVSPGAR